MKNLDKLFIFFIVLAMQGCGVFRDTASDGFADGKYYSRKFESGQVYIKNSPDSLQIYVYKLCKVKGTCVVDSNKPITTIYTTTAKERVDARSFNAFSLDFDALTIPFKYRFVTKSLPQQFTTSLNGGVYLGFRNDNYKLSYKRHFFNYYQREIRHYAISFGGFMGFGSTAMNPWVTNYNITSEYEGVVWFKGAALIMAVGKYTSGISIGWDNLLDKNKKIWIYEDKPWIGLVFGLNLN